MKKERSHAATEHGENGSGVAAVVLGIQAVIFAVIAPLVGVLLGFIALGFARAQKRKQNNIWARSGTILGVIGLVISVVLIIVIMKNPELATQAGLP